MSLRLPAHMRQRAAKPSSVAPLSHEDLQHVGRTQHAPLMHQCVSTSIVSDRTLHAWYMPNTAWAEELPRHKHWKVGCTAPAATQTGEA